MQKFSEYCDLTRKDVLFFILLSFAVLSVSDILLNYSIVTGSYSFVGFPNFGYMISFLLIGLAGVVKIQSLKGTSKKQILQSEAGYYSKYIKAYHPFFWVIIIFIVFLGRAPHSVLSS